MHIDRKTAQIGENLLERFFIPFLASTKPTTLTYHEERGYISAYYGDKVEHKINPNGEVDTLQSELDKTVCVVLALGICRECEEKGKDHKYPFLAIYAGFDKEATTFGREISEFKCPDGGTYGDCIVHINHLIWLITGEQNEGCLCL